MSEPIKRILTIFVIVFLLSVLFTIGTDNSIKYTIYAIALLTFYEWLSLTSKPPFYIAPFLLLIFMLEVYIVECIHTLLLISLVIWLLVIILTFYFRILLESIIKSYSLIIGIYLCTSLFLFLMNLYPTNTLDIDKSLIANKHYFIILISLISLIDMFAYISGKAMGRNKINSSISPNKTYEGYVGSIFLTFSAFMLISSYINFVWTLIDLLFLFILIILAFFGDFFMSLIKRVFSTKDSGTILPGHGGLLDRLDSYFSALPIFYLWFLI